jgi:cobalt transporter subunit CbtB
MDTPAVTSAAATPVAVSLGRAAWLIAATLFAIAVVYVVGLEQGATSLFGGNSYVHEFMHDARHLLGFPCH